MGSPVPAGGTALIHRDLWQGWGWGPEASWVPVVLQKGTWLVRCWCISMCSRFPFSTKAKKGGKGWDNGRAPPCKNWGASCPEKKRGREIDLAEGKHCQETGGEKTLNLWFPNHGWGPTGGSWWVGSPFPVGHDAPRAAVPQCLGLMSHRGKLLSKRCLLKKKPLNEKIRGVWKQAGL